MNQVDYDPKVSELINGIPTAKDQDGITMEERTMTYIVYSNTNEVIICVPETEDITITEFFTFGNRCLEDYSRDVIKDCGVSFCPQWGLSNK